jgi:hypothetical protein
VTGLPAARQGHRPGHPRPGNARTRAAAAVSLLHALQSQQRDMKRRGARRADAARREEE